MPLPDLKAEIGDYTPPYFRFPEHPEVIKVDGHEAYRYIIGTDLSETIDDFSRRINLNWFDVVCTNLAGGHFFTIELLRRQKFQGYVVDIEYHEDRRVVIPVPDAIKGKKVAVVDDVMDKFITGGMIQADAPQSTLLYLTKKREVTPSNGVHNCFWASEVDNQWLLGGGMNGELDGDGLPKDWGRTYYGIAAKIQDKKPS